MKRVCLLALFVVSVFLLAPGVAAQDTLDVEDPVVQRLIAEGRVVYDANCVGCHQADGRGVVGVFPPLVDNDNVDDADYVEMVVRDGLEGELIVAGTTYDGAMPAFSALDDDQVEAVAAFVQQGFDLAAPEPTAAPPIAPVSDGLPFGTVLAYVAGFGVFGAAGAVILWPVAAANRSQGRFSTLEVWLKAILIFGYFTIATVIVPSMVVESSFLASPPSVYLDLVSASSWNLVRDLIGTGVWLVALGAGLWFLRWAQRRGRL